MLFHRSGSFAGRLLLGLLGLGLLLGPVVSTVDAQSDAEGAFNRWLKTVRIRAIEKGVDPSVLDTHLSGVSLDTRVLKNSSNQAEFNTPFNEYRGYFLTSRMIEKGKLLRKKHRSTLRKLESTYGVPAEILVAIWGIESRYGEQRSRYSALSSLASMAFGNPSRRQYFTGELITVLEMIENDRIRSDNLESSWAGALGQPQFMPSSYRHYAVDFDGDGHRDIWDTPADVLGSIANYLAKNGWDPSATWGRKLAEGESPSNGTVYSPRGTTVRYERLDNFSVLLSYNQSKFYALTVGLLSEEIGGLREPAEK